MIRHVVGKLCEFPPGTRRIVSVGSRSIGIFHHDGKFFALRNQCPHQGGPLCEGTLSGTMIPGAVGEFAYGMEGRIIRCPWHNWEFDITSGEMVFVPEPQRVRTFEVTVETFSVGVEDQLVVLYL